MVGEYAGVPVPMAPPPPPPPPQPVAVDKKQPSPLPPTQVSARTAARKMPKDAIPAKAAVAAKPAEKPLRKQAPTAQKSTKR
jgi:hypothetical protein